MNIQTIHSNDNPAVIKPCTVTEKERGIFKGRENLIRKTNRLALTIMFGCTWFNVALAGQSVTGKIIIDGVVYGEGSSQMVKGSGVFGREQRQVNEFHSVIIKGGIDVNFERENDFSFELTGDNNLFKLIKADVDSGVLTIGSTESYQTTMPLTVSLTGSHLSALQMGGAGNIKLLGLKEKSIQLNLNGSGDVKAEGITQQLEVRLNGSSDVDAKSLNSDSAVIQILGSGNIDVNVKQLLDVSIIGSGNVTYFGHPAKIEQQIIGSGVVEAGD